MMVAIVTTLRTTWHRVVPCPHVQDPPTLVPPEAPLALPGIVATGCPESIWLDRTLSAVARTKALDVLSSLLRPRARHTYAASTCPASANDTRGGTTGALARCMWHDNSAMHQGPTQLLPHPAGGGGTASPTPRRRDSRRACACVGVRGSGTHQRVSRQVRDKVLIFLMPRVATGVAVVALRHLATCIHKTAGPASAARHAGLAVPLKPDGAPSPAEPVQQGESRRS